MFKYLTKRLSEGSTWAALAAIIGGTGVLGKINEAQPVADAVTNAGAAVAAGIDPMTAAAVAITGIVSVFLRDKGDK